MEQKKTCEICNRLYKAIPLPYDSRILSSSSVRITIRQPDKTAIIFYNDICPNCAAEINWHIKTMRRNAPKKCDFCNFDRGPLYEDPQPECRDCVKHSNFQLKKRMTKIEKLKWDYFNGDLEKSLKGE